jgi:hypothetical protein
VLPLLFSFLHQSDGSRDHFDAGTLLFFRQLLLFYYFELIELYEKYKRFFNLAHGSAKGGYTEDWFEVVIARPQHLILWAELPW